MARRLPEKARILIVQMVCTGRTNDEIYLAFDEHGWDRPSHTTIAYYRKKYGADVESVKDKGIRDALRTGFANKANRVKALNAMASIAEARILDDGWDVKTVRIFCDLLKQIAEEMGHIEKHMRIGLDDRLTTVLERIYAARARAGHPGGDT